MVKSKPGISVPELLENLRKHDQSIAIGKIRNELRRELANYVEHRESNKTGGYYLRQR